MVTVAVVMALAGATAAQAAPVQGYGEPFATATWSCPDTRSPSAPVVGEHPDAMVRVTFDERPDGRPSAPSIDLGEDPFIWNVTEYFGVTGERWWWPAGTIGAGRTLAPMPDCGYEDYPPFTGKAEYFDRPTTPFTFSDPTVRHASSPSILGFVVPQAGDYVADISVTKAQLRVLNPDLEIGDDAQNLGGTWHVDYDAPGTTLRTSLPLGRFEPGLHDLPYQFVSGIHAPGADFSIAVRLAQEPQAAPAGPPPATPPPLPRLRSPAPSASHRRG